MLHQPRRRARVSALVAATCAWSLRAAALDPSATDLAGARELFTEGVALEHQEAWSAALDRFRRAEAIVVTPKVRFHVALCLEHTGKLVLAINEFAAAKNASESTDADLAAEASRHLDALEASVAHVAVNVPRDAPRGASVRIDGVPLPPSLWDTEIPADPGAHEIVASSPGRSEFVRRVELRRGERATLDVTFPIAVASEPPHAAPAAARRASPWPWITGGAALVMLGASGASFALRAATISDLDVACPGRVCTGAQRGEVARGQAYTTLGNVLLAAGAVTLGASAVLFITAPSPAQPPTVAVRVAY